MVVVGNVLLSIGCRCLMVVALFQLPACFEIKINNFF